MTNVVAMPAPSAKVRPSAAAAVTVSVRVSAASVATAASISSCAPRAKRRRSTMSATVPVRSASSTAGTLFAVCTSAIRVSESDTEAITVTAPTVFIQITSCDPASADHTARKPARRSGARAESLAAVASGWVGALRVMGSEDAANVCIMLKMAAPNARPGARTTLRDVARLAGVHPATASRALNEETRSLVNEETARRVLRAAEAVGYRPNPIARGLKTNRSYTIGVLIPDLTNPLFPPIVRGIEDTLGQAGYTALLANSDNDPDKERLHFETMKDRQVEAFIMATAERDHPLIEDAIAQDVPIVLVNRTVDSSRAFAVITDDRRGTALAVKHLVDLGHTRIAHI